MSDINDVKSFMLHWPVPLKQFQVDSRLFRPLPPLDSPIMTTPLEKITLDWSLTLTQTQNDARVTLHHRTEGIPNMGVQFVVFALKKDGTTGKLSSMLRDSLSNCRKPGNSPTKPLTKALLHTNEYIFEGNDEGSVSGQETVHLRVALYISESRFDPKKIMNFRINEYQKLNKGTNLMDGTVGERLWAQSEEGILCDVEFNCAGTKVFAHSSVLLAYSPMFAKALTNKGYKKDGWHMSSNGVHADALREVLHWVYRRTVSPTIHLAPLNEILEAAKLFDLPSDLVLHVEKLLCSILSRQNLGKMWKMSQVFDLKLIQNMTLTLVNGNRGELEALVYVINAGRQPTSQVSTGAAESTVSDAPTMTISSSNENDQLFADGNENGGNNIIDLVAVSSIVENRSSSPLRSSSGLTASTKVSSD